MGTFAFLGPQYDGELERFYTATTDDDIYADRGFSGLLRDSVRDSAPLRRLIERTIDERILEAVAGEHRRGRRFYVGTTNLDSARLVVWDMGGIAASNRADRLQRFHDVLLASASVPMVFPPVYFPVEWEGRTYWQMHVDGGAAVSVFLSGFVIDELNRLTGLGTERGGVVRPLSTAATVTQLVRLYRATRGVGFGFHFASIPADYPLRLPAIRFEPGGWAARAFARLRDWARGG